MQKSKDFYVYLHRRATDGKVFYVGKGHGRRATHFLNRNRHWNNVAKKHGVIVEFYATGLQEWYAFELEIMLISYYGIENLCNLTHGGEGLYGMKMSEDQKAKIGMANKGKKISDELKKHLSLINKGRKHTEETKIKIGVATRNESKETRQKRIDTMSKKVKCSNGMIFKNTVEATIWLKENGFPNARANSICECRTGNKKTYCGYGWSYA